MVHVVVRHEIEDYAKWKKEFDEGSADRKAAGSQGGAIYRTVDNPNKIAVALVWDTLENAQKFTNSDKIKQAMEKAGVIGAPQIIFSEKSDDVTE